MKKIKIYQGILLFCGILVLAPAAAVSAAVEDTTASASADENTNDFIPSLLPSPEFSAKAGFYEDALTLTLSVPDGYRIYMTFDGSLPGPENEAASLYTEPLVLTDLRDETRVTKAWVIRAVTVTPDSVCGDVVTKTYFVGNGMTSKYSVPVVSLVTDADNLYNEETGIYTHSWESGREWERPFHFEYFTREEGLVVSLNCGGRVHGGASRDIDMKSLRLYARAEYDTQKNFKYDFFSDGTLPAVDVNGKTIKKFKRLLLRGGGNEATAWDRTYFRDTLAAWTMRDTGLDVQAAQPIVVFLNGTYYGIMNLRERQDERYIEEHYGLDPAQIAVYSFWYDEDGEIHIEADADTDELAWQAKTYYEEIFHFATTADLTVPENYEKVCAAFDIENYIDYLCVELFCDNTDWPGNNCKAWRYTGEAGDAYGSDGKIRWLLYDTEFGFGLYGRDPSDDSITAALSATSKEWPNQHGSTLLFRSLLQNESFYDAFVSRMLDLLNENFAPKALKWQADTMAGYYKALIQENRDAGNWFDSYENNVSNVKKFIDKRPNYMYMLLGRRFDLGTRYTLNIAFDTSMGCVTLNTITAAEGANCVGSDGFSGIYYNHYPVEVTAIPAEGYHFVGFTGSGLSALFSADGTRIDPADQENSSLLHYTAEDGTIAAILTSNRISVQNPDADGRISLTAVFEKDGASPSYLETVGAVLSNTDTPSENSGDAANGTEGGTPENSAPDNHNDGSKADNTDSGTTAPLQTPEQSAAQNPAEFILLCILLAVVLAFVTFLGVRASKRRFRR